MRLFHRAFHLFLLFLITAVISGCSQKFSDVNDTLNIALFGDTDTRLDRDDIRNLPYASIYARIGDGPQAFMVLALAETPTKLGTQTQSQLQGQPLQLKWLSSDKGMLVTEYGRLVKTLNLPQGNLLSTLSQHPDPLRLGLQLPNTPKHWQRTIDWQPGYHLGYQLKSTFSRRQDAVIMLNDRPVEVLYFTEDVTVNSLDIEYQNEFWIHPETGKVLKSKQKLAPSLPYIEITLLKPYS
ncbi:Putative lipoprotein YmcC precursor [Photobacterium marinum]|uniref:Putative lipoprotein YmcC n=1 Tax=Photobacterium marinum TaxID=1056511 RepID=L8J4M2_9GAMM|nr:YjbF family lipoprotein [Photobacterium marinum]ELR63785.1 Putative lipoprotein YmcC precursor [Photobacterium marinum]